MAEQNIKKSPGAIKSFLSGFGMGVANVIPGVSGGTVAFITGIFEPLVETISAIASAESLKLFFSLRWKELFHRLELKFLLCLFAGVAVALVTASKIIIMALENYPGATFALFLGMMVASVVLMWKDVSKWNIACVVSFIAGCAAAFAIINSVPVDTPKTWWMSFISGAISVMAMILPGISGSFLLLIIGQYTVLWGAVAKLPGPLTAYEIITLVSFLAGSVAGLAAFAKILGWLFKKYHDITAALLIGFMAGSLPRLWPWNMDKVFSVKTAEGITRLTLPEDNTALEAAKAAGADITALEFEYALPSSFTFSEFWLPVILIVIGAAAVVVMEKVSSDKNKTDIAE